MAKESELRMEFYIDLIRTYCKKRDSTLGVFCGSKFIVASLVSYKSSPSMLFCSTFIPASGINPSVHYITTTQFQSFHIVNNYPLDGDDSCTSYSLVNSSECIINYWFSKSYPRSGDNFGINCVGYYSNHKDFSIIPALGIVITFQKLLSSYSSFILILNHSFYGIVDQHFHDRYLLAAGSRSTLDYRDFIHRECPYDLKKNSSSDEAAMLSMVTRSVVVPHWSEGAEVELFNLEASNDIIKDELYADLGAGGMMYPHTAAPDTQPHF